MQSWIDGKGRVLTGVPRVDLIHRRAVVEIRTFGPLRVGAGQKRRGGAGVVGAGLDRRLGRCQGDIRMADDCQIVPVGLE